MFDGPAAFGCRKVVSSRKALEDHGIEPIPLASKEHLGILNGTTFSAAVASLALHEAVQLAFLTQICTAMGTEALAGTRSSFDPFISNGALPRPGQIEVPRNLWNLLDGSTFAQTREEEVTIDQDEGVLRQDPYPLRTAPQIIGLQILHSLKTITTECNSSQLFCFVLFCIVLMWSHSATDNPLVDGETGKVHHFRPTLRSPTGYIGV